MQPGRFEEGRVDYDNPDNPIFRISIDDHDYGFTIASFEKDSHEWLVDRLNEMCLNIHLNACEKTRKEIGDGLKNLLGWTDAN